MVKLSEVQKSAKDISHGLDFGNDVFIDLKHNKLYFHNKSGLIHGLNLRRYCNFGPIAKSLPSVNNLNKFLTVIAIGRKFKFSAQGSDLAPFVEDRTKIKIPSEIKPALVCMMLPYSFHADNCALM